MAEPAEGSHPTPTRHPAHNTALPSWQPGAPASPQAWASASSSRQAPESDGTVSDPGTPSSTSSWDSFTDSQYVAPDVTINAATLVLSPPEYEVLFWESPAIQRAAKVHDKWAAAFLLLMGCLYFRWQATVLPSRLTSTWGVVLLVCNVGHLCWLTAAPRSYVRYRSCILLSSRLLRLAHAATLVFLSRRSFHATDLQGIITMVGRPSTLLPSTLPSSIRLPSPHPTTSLLTHPATPPHPLPTPHPSPITALRLTLHATGASLSLFYAAIVPLPFLLQLPIHLGYLTLALAFQHPIGLRLLQRMHTSNSSTATCYNLNMVVDTASLAYLGAGPGTSRINKLCEQQADELLLVFVSLYFGFAVPLYIAYRVEHQQKSHYIEQLWRPPERRAQNRNWSRNRKRAGRSLVGWVAHQMVLLVLMGLQCWVVALKATPYLPWVVVPIRRV